jgi:multidrug efflux pump subunit AcrA (membrane-fusion protein)
MPTANNPLRSQTVNEMMSSRPGNMTRWGATVFLCLLVIVCLLTWLIHYPDIIAAKGKLQAINGPKEVLTKQSGKLEKLFYKEGEEVKENTIIGFMESTAKHEEVIALAQLLDSIQSLIDQQAFEQLPNLLQASFANLGELQTGYQTFQTSFLSFKNYLSSGFYLRKKVYLRNEVGFLQRMKSNLVKQKNLQSKDIDLQTQTYSANEQLSNSKVIAPLELRKEQSALIGKQMSMPQMGSSILQNESQQNAKLQEIAELDNQIVQQKNLFIESLHTLQSQVADWQKKYLLMAPIAGTFSLNGFLQEKQQMQANQLVGTVSPANSSYYAEVQIPQVSFGKVNTDQVVQIKLESYPYEQYGMLKGHLVLFQTAELIVDFWVKLFLIMD